MTSPLKFVADNCQTVLWNDSADPQELADAISWGAVGATCNPVIALTALKANAAYWSQQVRTYAQNNPTATDDQIGWEMVKQLSLNAAELLEPAFEKYQGRNGRLSIQTDPRLHRDPHALVEQAAAFNSLAKNIIVKIPVTTQAVSAFEEATYRGISINATVSFSVAQTLAVAEGVERGLKRREAEGLDISQMGPVCTIMVGRTDDWIKVVDQREKTAISADALEWSGIAAFKNAYRIYQERGYRTRLLAAAFRNTMHWSQLLGGDCVISPPYAWQVKINESGISPNLESIHEPVPPAYLDELLNKSSEFRKAYQPDGLAIADFSTYGATARTLRGFLQATHDLEVFVRDTLVADPD